MTRLGHRASTHPIPSPLFRVVNIGPASSSLIQLLRKAVPLGPVLAIGLLAAGCSTPNIGTDVAMTGMPNAEVALRDSVRLVDAEMGKLGVMTPTPLSRGAGPVVPGELQRVVTFSYTGSLEDGVRQLAGNVGYTVAVSPPPSGQAPAQVAVATGTVPIIQAFQALGEAAGTRAMVTVDPARRQVDVTYRA